MSKDNKADTLFYAKERDPEMWICVSPNCGYNLTS